MIKSAAPLQGVAPWRLLVAPAGSSWSSQKHGGRIAPVGSLKQEAGSAVPGELLTRLNAWVLALLCWPGLSPLARELCGVLAVGICVLVVVLPSFALVLVFLNASLGSMQLNTSCGSLPPGYAANSALLCSMWSLGLYQLQGLSLTYRYRGFVARTVLLWIVLCFSLTLALAVSWVPRRIAEGPAGIAMALTAMMSWLNITLPSLINSVSKMLRLRALPVAKRGLVFVVLGVVTILMGLSPQAAVLAAKYFSGIFDFLISGLFLPVFVWCMRRAVTLSYAPFLESSTGERKIDLIVNMGLLTKIYASVPQSFILLTLGDYGTFFGAALSSALFELGACALFVHSEEREQRRNGKRRAAQEQHLEQHRDQRAAPAHAQEPLSHEQREQQASQQQAQHLQQQEQKQEQQLEQQEPELHQAEQHQPDQQQPEQQQPD